MDVPPAVAELIGRACHEAVASEPVTVAEAETVLDAVADANPRHRDPSVAAALTGGPVLPASTLSSWMRPRQPSDADPPLALHVEVKERLGLPEAIMTGLELELHEPVRPGDTIRHHQVLRSVGDPTTNRLGTGRSWTIEVVYHNQRDELVGIERYTAFGFRRPS